MVRNALLITLFFLAFTALLLAGCGCRGPAETGEAGRAAEQQKPALPSHTVHVFCYHGVQPETSNFYFNTSADFEEQMRILADEGYQSITCKQLADYLAGEEDIPDKSVVISFDDGNLCVYENAVPIMEKYGFKATLFIITDSVGGKNHLSWQQVEELHAKGYEIGSHTSSHANLVKRGEDTVEEHQASIVAEVTASKAQIEEVIGEAVIALAYPYGTYEDGVISAVREAGYRMAFSIDRGAIDENSNPWRLPRQMVVKGNSVKTFKRWLSQEPLHLASLSPRIGEVVTDHDIKIHARLLDDDVDPGTLSVTVEPGKKTDQTANEETNELTISVTLDNGANNIRIQHQGSPPRERSWVVVCRP